MAHKRNALRTGLFTIISLMLAVFAIIAISGSGQLFQSTTTYGVAFSLQDDIGGLRIGDDVRIGGMKVGDVKSIEILPSAPAPAPVVMDAGPQATTHPAASGELVVYIAIPTKYPLAKNASVFIQRGLTGSSSMNIDDLGSGGPIASGEFLRGQPDPVLGLFHQLAQLQPDLRQTMSNVRVASGKLSTDLDKFGTTADSFTETGLTATATVQDFHARLPDIVDRYDDLTSSAVSALKAVRDFVGPSTATFAQTVANLQRITANIRTRLPELLDRANSILAKADTAMGRLNATMTNLHATLDNTRSLTGAVRSIVADNRSKFDEIFSSLRTTSENLKYASIEIRHAPWRLLYQPKPGEVANLNTYDSVRQFAEGASSLDDAAAALRDALNDKNADPQQIKKLMTQLDLSFAKFQQVQSDLWQQIKP